MADYDIALMAHLMRRAGFGAPRGELDAREARGYEATVEELLHTEAQEPVDILEFLRYHPWAWKPGTMSNPGAASWLYRMITSQRPLEEKMALMWHGVFATGLAKVTNMPMLTSHYEMLRDHGLGNFGDMLKQLS